MAVVEGGRDSKLITHYFTGGDDDMSFGRFTHLAQTFTLDQRTAIYFVAPLISPQSGKRKYYGYIYETDLTGKPIFPPIYTTYLIITEYYEFTESFWYKFKFKDFPVLDPGVYAFAISSERIVWPGEVTWHNDIAGAAYPLGKAWLSLNSGNTWNENPGMDFYFQVWGWPPPPEPPPKPVISNWAPLTETETKIDDGFEIVVTTDIPVHLFLRWTDKPPLTHPTTELRRGLLVQTATRYCFVAFSENEQLEPGDTLTHTFRTSILSAQNS